MESQNQLWVMISDVFFRCHLLRRFLFVFGRFQTLKNRFSLQRGAHVHKTDVFRQSAEKIQCWPHFGMPKPLTIDKISCMKLMFFSTPCCFRFFLLISFWSEISVFFRFSQIVDFVFGPILGPSMIRSTKGTPVLVLQNRSKNDLRRVRPFWCPKISKLTKTDLGKEYNRN